MRSRHEDDVSRRPPPPTRPPSVERVLAAVRPVLDDATDPDVLVAAARGVVDVERQSLRAGNPARDLEDLAADVTARLRPGPVGPTPVINATGVLVHTNLGRVTWPRAAIEAASRAASSSLYLELDRVTGRRGRRYAAAEDLLIALTGAEDALIVNNNAAAVALA